jgi:hypothetical protein
MNTPQPPQTSSTSLNNQATTTSSSSFSLFPAPTPSLTPSATNGQLPTQSMSSSLSSTTTLPTSSTSTDSVTSSGGFILTPVGSAPPLPSVTDITVTTNAIQTYILEGFLGGILVLLILGLVMFCFWHRVLARILATKAERNDNRRSSNNAQIDSASQEERESSIQRHVARWRTFLESPPDRQTQPVQYQTMQSAHDSRERASWLPFPHPQRREPPLLTRTLSNERRRIANDPDDITVLQLATRPAMYFGRSRARDTGQIDHLPNLTSPARRREALYSVDSTGGDEGYESMRMTRKDTSSRASSWIPRLYGRMSGFSTSEEPPLASVLPGALERMGYRGNTSSELSTGARR